MSEARSDAAEQVAAAAPAAAAPAAAAPAAASADSAPAEKGERRGLSRRGMLALFGGSAAGIAVGAAGAAAIMSTGAPSNTKTGQFSYPFYGEYQAGITTPMQEHLYFAAFDLAPDVTRDDLIELLQDWTYASSRITQGLDVSVSGAFAGGANMPADDSGEATNIAPSGLTITFGFGRSLFETAEGVDRFQLAKHLPPEFTGMPKMMNDFINRQKSEGDLCIQACANDLQVAVHAIRNLSRIAFGRAQLRWSQMGFMQGAQVGIKPETPRNLFGQKDGTMNLRAEETEAIAKHVLIDAKQGPSWSTGGTYLVARRINMTIEVWDGVLLGEQDRVLGRTKQEGAPLSGGTEFSQPDFKATDDKGALLMDERSHVARVHPANNDGIRMLRRSYNFVDGNDDQGRLDAGLFFVAFVSAPERFAKVHTNMARDDMFIEYLKTTSSSVFLAPPGIKDGQFIGQQLFKA